MRIELTGKVALVTGAGRGIGRQIAFNLIQAGARVGILEIDSQSAAECVESIVDNGGTATFRTVDISNRSAAFDAINSIMGELGQAEILVNNAGFYRASELLGVTEEEWRKTLDTNLSGAFWCTQAVAQSMIAAKSGRIVNISSIGGKIGWPNNHAYCSSKAGLIGLTKVLASELGPHGITVNAVCPGNTDTDMMTQVDRDVSAEMGLPAGTFRASLNEKIPMRRLGTCNDVAALVAYLCSHHASFINGQAINVDGGLLMF